MHGGRVLLFDLGGVLVDVAGPGTLKTTLAPALDDETFVGRWLASPSLRDLQLGRLSPAQFSAAFVREWDLAVSPDELLVEFDSWVRGPYPGAEQLLADLGTEGRVCCLSNSNEVHWSKLRPLLTRFEAAFSSHQLGVGKPDEEAFRITMERLGAEPGQITFFDDDRANVEAARRLAMTAHQVKGIGAVRAVLTREGLL